MISQILKSGTYGFISTVPMTVWMVLLKNHFFNEEHPIPPRIVTMETARKTGIKKFLNEKEKQELSYATHFAFGTFVGSIFLPFIKSRRHLVLKGIGHGLGVWAVNYGLLLPAAGLVQWAHRSSRRRNILLITSHIIWGGSLGFLAKTKR